MVGRSKGELCGRLAVRALKYQRHEDAVKYAKSEAFHNAKMFEISSKDST